VATRGCCCSVLLLCGVVALAALCATIRLVVLSSAGEHTLMKALGANRRVIVVLNRIDQVRGVKTFPLTATTHPQCGEGHIRSHTHIHTHTLTTCAHTSVQTRMS